MALTWISERTDIIMGTGSMGNMGSTGMEGNINMVTVSKIYIYHIEHRKTACWY